MFSISFTFFYYHISLIWYKSIVNFINSPLKFCAITNKERLHVNTTKHKLNPVHRHFWTVSSIRAGVRNPVLQGLQFSQIFCPTRNWDPRWKKLALAGRTTRMDWGPHADPWFRVCRNSSMVFMPANQPTIKSSALDLKKELAMQPEYWFYKQRRNCRMALTPLAEPWAAS